VVGPVWMPGVILGGLGRMEVPREEWV